MTDYSTLTDPGANWCPDCGEPRSLCCCDDDYVADDDDRYDDPNYCPECGSDVTVYGDWCYCTDTNECGWSEYIGDDDE